MEEVETAAADTTSNSSSPHHHYSGTGPPAKRRRADLRVLSEGRLEEVEGYRHYSGRVLPVGIAQPFRSEGTSQGTPQQRRMDPRSQFSSKPTMGDSMDLLGWRGSFESASGKSLENKHLQNVLGSGGGDEKEASDSDQSSTRIPRFSRFVNESTGKDRQSMQLPPNTEVSDSESVSEEVDNDSSSSSNFTFAFAPPSTSTEGGIELEPERQSVEATMELTREPTAFSFLPPGKKYHVFVSHSTGDQQWARNSIIVPLRDTHGLQVKACYHFMPDTSRYDDRAIQNGMRESCVVCIGLTPGYLSSPR